MISCVIKRTIIPFSCSKTKTRFLDDATVTNSKIDWKYIMIFKHQDELPVPNSNPNSGAMTLTCTDWTKRCFSRPSKHLQEKAEWSDDALVPHTLWVRMIDPQLQPLKMNILILTAVVPRASLTQPGSSGADLLPSGSGLSVPCILMLMRSGQSSQQGRFQTGRADINEL